MVLGIKDTPKKDPTSQADNPILFYSLRKAVEFAKEVSQNEGCGKVVQIVPLFEINKKKRDLCPCNKTRCFLHK